MIKKLLFALMFVVCAGSYLSAQVTTSSLTGDVKSEKGEPLMGATITATHTPSGTVYSTITNKSGIFNLQGLRIGGPYSVKIDFVGHKSQVVDSIYLQLGEPYSVNAVMETDERELSTVVVTTRGRKATDKGGMSSVFNNRALTTLPTITRNISDFIRGTPQANGTSFAGRDARFNNITVDGANLNNNFGLSTDPLPGGGNNPVSLDALDEISVTIAPFDVRQGNFTGANIAAITKSGTNNFHASAYTYWQNQNMVGSNVAGVKAANPAFQSKIYGGSIGGPIIKNKLFFFINGEYEKRPPSAAGVTYTPTGGSGSGNISAVPVDSLQKVSDYVKSKQYDPGVFDNFSSFKNTNHKILAKLDWNINNSNKLTLKYSEFKGDQDFLPSQSGGINGASSTGLVTYGPKFSQIAMGFSGIIYSQQDVVRSASIELNSNFHSRFANQFLVTATKITSFKQHPGGQFPFVDIIGSSAGDKNNFISVGNEPFNANNNKVLNDVYTATDNFTYFAGKHTLTAGLSYEFQKVGNMFMAGSQGYYVYRSVNDFVTDAPPLMFSLTYSLDKSQDAIYSANLKIGQLAAYIQDDINVNSNLKVTAGIRIDKPIYPEQPLENPAISALVLRDHEGNPTSYTTGKWPKSTMLFSPRVGFRWDMEGDRKMILRGGTGIFTGRIPFVYLTNIPSNSGMYQFGQLITPTTPGVSLSNFTFNPDHHAYNPFYNNTLPANLFPTTAGTSAPAVFAVTNKNFKFPQIWRTNIGFDKQLGRTWKLTFEALYTKDINAIYMFNANQKAPDTVVQTGSVSRARYSGTSAAIRRVNTTVNNAIVLDNTGQGSSFVFTVQLAKSFSKGLYASLAYNYTFAQDVTANPGSQAASVWSANPTSRTQNDLELAYSNFAVPHRLLGLVSYHFEYLRHLGTTVSLIYDGKSGGTYSYIYNSDLNNDGNTSDLMYIPKNAMDPNEIKFQSSFAYPNGVTYTAAQMAQIFQNYIDQDPYLKKHKGQVAERNGAKLPWVDRLDMKVVQDLFSKIGSTRHTLQFTADIYNVINLINNDWGIRKINTLPNNSPLTVASVTAGVPTFRLNTFNNAPVTKTFQNNVSTSTTWAIQLGLRYSF